MSCNGYCYSFLQVIQLYAMSMAILAVRIKGKNYITVLKNTP